MFIDQVKIYVKAGDGGDGCASFRREKYVPHGGPDGGDGGRGGDIIIEASLELSTLLDLRYQQHYKIKHAGHGSGHGSSGKNCDDRIIKVPVGTIIKDKDSGEVLADLVEAGERSIVAKGGRGGPGNIHYKTSTNRAPTLAKPGEPGQERCLLLELKLLADVGLVGFPNAGKSSFIAAVTQARPKVADYPFTTIEPNLGVATWGARRGRRYHFTIADVPGLIEGAHEGKGLGLRFLKHLERTSILLHMVDISEMAEGAPIHDFEVIREEIERYHPEMEGKPFALAGTKIDIAGNGHKAEALRAYCAKTAIPFFEISSASTQGTKELIVFLGQAVEQNRHEAKEVAAVDD